MHRSQRGQDPKPMTSAGVLAVIQELRG